MSELCGAGYKLGLVSNTLFPGFAIDDMLRFAGLLDWLPVRLYSSEVRYMKPHRWIFERALDELGVAGHEAIFVGDRMDNDVKGASRVGMKTVLVAKNGLVPRGSVRPDHIIRRLSEVPQILRS
jgi:FMN phosphatase YigB (HAD superfamily)